MGNRAGKSRVKTGRGARARGSGGVPRMHPAPPVAGQGTAPAGGAEHGMNGAGTRPNGAGPEANGTGQRTGLTGPGANGSRARAPFLGMGGRAGSAGTRPENWRG